MLGRAGRGEGARNGEQRDGLAAGQVGDLERVGAQRAAGGFGFDEFGQGAIRHAVADFDRHFLCGLPAARHGSILTGLAWILATAAAPAWAAPDANEQAQYDSFVVAAGASNGAARACGASEPDLAQHQATAKKNLTQA
ncbi:hypothetical protein G6F57_019257 [Rhizopus arrhizus]|nr:hypothetical protein G6F57_019257 [Rhizopus arrhizus]